MSSFNICDGVLLTKAGKIRLDEIDYIIPRKGILNNYAFIGSRSGIYVKLKVSNADIEQILSESKAAKAPMWNNWENIIEFDNAIETLKSGKRKNISKNCVIMTEERVIYIPKRRFWASDYNPVCVRIGDVVFSNTTQNTLFGFIPTGYRTYFGTSLEQAVFVHPSKDHGERLNTHLINNGSAIGTTADITFKDTFWFGKLKSPLKFFIHEEIGLTQDAIIYKFKRGKNTDTIYLPFDRIHYINIKPGLFRSNGIIICGEQNIITHLQFKNKDIAMIKGALVDLAIPFAERIIRPTYMMGLFTNPFAKRSLAVVGDRLIYTDAKAKKSISYCLHQVDDLVWKKKFFFYFFGYLFISGAEQNIRQDQVGVDSLRFCIPKISYKTKNYIKKLCSSADYNDKVSKKFCDISSIKYS